MVVVELFDDYFVEIDEYNHTLKQRFKGKKEDGSTKESERTFGYFPNMPSCMEKLARMNVINELDGKCVSAKEYALKAEEAFKKCSAIKIS